MSQKKNPKVVKANEALAYGKFIRGSERKLNLLAQMIRGKKAGRALVDLEFSQKRMAHDVRRVLQSAIANAENNHNLDVDRLIVASATVGKAIKMKRFHARGRGKAAGVVKKFSNITIIVAEAEEKVAKAKKSEAKAEKTKAENKPKKSKKAQGAKA
jgi:large subunit ribosomal protein L22